MQIRGLGGEHRDDLVQIPVGGGPRDAVIAGHRISVVRSRNHRRPSTACQKQEP
jgi:hypothetical protein